MGEIEGSEISQFWELAEAFSPAWVLGESAAHFKWMLTYSAFPLPPFIELNCNCIIWYGASSPTQVYTQEHVSSQGEVWFRMCHYWESSLLWSISRETAVIEVHWACTHFVLTPGAKAMTKVSLNSGPDFLFLLMDITSEFSLSNSQDISPVTVWF